MNQRKRLLHLGTIEEATDWVPRRLSALGAELDISWKQRLGTPDTITEIEIQCRTAQIEGIVCTDQLFLDKLLRAQPDFIPPPNRKQLSLDDYQGSLLFTPKDKIPVVIVNPLANLLSVPHATPAAKRFISKLANPGKWYRATKFEFSVGTPANLPGIYQRMQEADLIGVDIETIRDDPERRIDCISFAAYFSKSHTTLVVVIPFTDLFFIEWTRKFCDLQPPKVFQNGLYDNLYLLRWGCPVRNWLHDTQHLFHSMFSEYPKRLSFVAAYALRNIRYWKDDGKTGNLLDYYRYNALDSWATVNSYVSLICEAEPYAIRNYLMEFPLVFPCLNCEIEGIKVDMERLAVVKAQKEQKVNMELAEFQTMIAAPAFNPNSPPQKMNLFKVLGLGHLPNTAKASMLKAQASSPFNNRILSDMVSIIKEAKLVNTYFQPDKFWHGRCYYKINPAGTDTGRLASTESSYWCGLQIQNIPRDDSVKQCLVSDPGYYLCEIDKAQAEARCVGYLAGETALIDLVEGPHDYHSYNAQRFFGVPYETIYSDEFHKTLNKELRDLSKRTNHGANYNMGAGVMLDTMGPKDVARAKILLRLQGSLREVCQILLDRYAATYPRVKGSWYESIIMQIKLTGKLVNPFGRTRVFFGKPWLDKRALNAAVAHQPQSTSVDAVNIEFYDLWRSQIYGSFFRGGKEIICDLRGKIRIKAQIHDSLFFQYLIGKANEWIPQTVRDVIMTTRVKITDPHGVTREMYIPSDIGCGKERWSELK